MIFRYSNTLKVFLLHSLFTFEFGENLSADKLITLSKSILDRLDQQAGTGNEIVRDMKQYYSDLKQVLEEVRNDTKDGEILYTTLRDQYGPHHTKLMFINYVYMDCYNWTFDESANVKKLLDDTRELWRHIERTAIERPYGIRLS